MSSVTPRLLLVIGGRQLRLHLHHHLLHALYLKINKISSLHKLINFYNRNTISNTENVIRQASCHLYMNFNSPNVAAQYNIESKIEIQNIQVIQKKLYKVIQNKKYFRL